MNSISSTIKINDKTGTFYCDTSRGYFTIYLPLPNIATEDETNDLGSDKLTFIKSNKDSNKITIKGMFPGNSDSILLSEGQISLKSENGEWVIC